MSDCVETTFYRDQWGYGHFKRVRFGKKINLTHVLAWIDANGRLPGEGMCICHHCDNPSCVNPEHLFEATHHENILDMVAKGRQNMQLKTHCRQGHLYDEANTRVYRGSRYCRKCDLFRARRRRKQAVSQ